MTDHPRRFVIFGSDACAKSADPAAFFRRSHTEIDSRRKETTVIRQMTRSCLAAMLICATLLVTTGFPRPQSGSAHPLEGLYEVSIKRGDVGGGIRFLVSLTRQGSSWVGEVSETPVPVTVKNITVIGDNSLTGTATVDEKGEAISITLKADGSKITCSVKDGERTATLTATKNASQEKATIDLEGIYDAHAVLDGGNSLAFELVIKRMKPADK
jgi:hypothetical protein